MLSNFKKQKLHSIDPDQYMQLTRVETGMQILMRNNTGSNDYYYGPLTFILTWDRVQSLKTFIEKFKANPHKYRRLAYTVNCRAYYYPKNGLIVESDIIDGVPCINFRIVSTSCFVDLSLNGTVDVMEEFINKLLERRIHRMKRRIFTRRLK